MRRRIFRTHWVPVSAVPVLRSESLCWRAVLTQFSNRVEVLKNTQMKDITIWQIQWYSRFPTIGCTLNKRPSLVCAYLEYQWESLKRSILGPLRNHFFTSRPLRPWVWAGSSKQRGGNGTGPECVAHAQLLKKRSVSWDTHVLLLGLVLSPTSGKYHVK